MLTFLPPATDIETIKVLKKLAKAHRALAELKGLASTIPNQSILINTLVLQEAKESSAVENIITTFDEMYRFRFVPSEIKSQNTKEVYCYADALLHGFQLLQQKTLITNHEILQIQELVEQNTAGYRRQAGTVLKNEVTGEVVYEPPQSHDDISSLMANLIDYINDDTMHDADPLVKMAIIHHQFESIHPFYDGNGRTGRIINILYLVKCGLIQLPILYMSSYIIRHKAEYYKQLQSVRETGDWESWVWFMLDSVEYSALDAIKKISKIKDLMQFAKTEIRTKFPKMYTQDLLNNLFRHPYTKIDFLSSELGIGRATATKHLLKLTEIGILKKVKVGRDVYFINDPLFQLLSNGRV